MVEVTTGGNCEEISPKFLLFNNILLHCLILFIILAALFKYIIAPLATRSINGEFIEIINILLKPEVIQKIINNKNSRPVLQAQLQKLLNINMANPTQVAILNKVMDYIINTNPDQIKDLFQNLANNYAAHETDLRVKQNEGMYKKLFTIIILMIIIAIVINIFPKLFGNKCTGIKHLGIELVAIFLCVGIIEFWFFMNIGKKFVPVMPSVITQTFKDKMMDLVNEPPAPEYIPISKHETSSPSSSSSSSPSSHK
jgi:hypothetical protein